jgi:hypothetical protein
MPLTRRKAKRAVKRYWPLGAAAVGLLALVVAWMLLPAAEWIDSLGQKVAELGWAGPVIYFVLYVVGTNYPRAVADNEHRRRGGFRLVGITAVDCRRYRWGDGFVLFVQIFLQQ